MARRLQPGLCYLDVLHTAPERAVDALREVVLTTSDTNEVLKFFGNPFLESHTDEQWRTLIETGMPELLLDLLLNEDIYEFRRVGETGTVTLDYSRIVSKYYIFFAVFVN